MNTKKPRGSILLFTIVLVIPILLILAGVAVDLSMLYAARSELHRSTDAAALAGAGKLGFTSADFPNAYSFAQTFADNNPTNLGGTVGTLQTDQTTPCDRSSAPCARTILGVWDPGTSPPFTPSSDGFVVNAVQVSASQDISTYFLNMVGISSLRATAFSVGVSNPPQFPPACPLPFAPTYCSFVGDNGFNSSGCGAYATFASSSGHIPGIDPSATNTSAWVQMNPPGTGTPNKNDTQAALDAFTSGNCNTLSDGEQLGATNGQGDNAATFRDWLQTQWNVSGRPLFTNFGSSTSYGIPPQSPPQPLTKDGQTVFAGVGLKAVVPIIDIPGGTSACTGGVQAINQARTIQTFAWFVVTQATDQQGNCALPPENDLGSQGFCNATGNNRVQNVVFGYYDCGNTLGPPVIHPAPRAALATKLRLVQ
jgi:Flp pilus assembly protein TadG